MPRKPMTLEEKEKRAEQRAIRAAERQETRSKPLLKVGHWEIIRFDDENLSIVRNDGRPTPDRYYPDIYWAVTDLYRILVEEHLSRGVPELQNLSRALNNAETQLHCMIAEWFQQNGSANPSNADSGVL